MNFHEIRFPAAMSLGSSGGPERRTEIVTLANGFEERNSPWAQSRRRYDAGTSMRSLDDLAVLIGFFEARHGQLYGFRWKDWADFKSCLPSAATGPLDQVIGIGDGQTRAFMLSKSYRSGDAVYVRRIAKPVAGTVRVALGGDEVVAEVDHLAGVVHFEVAPPPDAVVSAGFEFDVPVRFATDRIEASAAGFNAGAIPSVPVIEVRLP